MTPWESAGYHPSKCKSNASCHVAARLKSRRPCARNRKRRDLLWPVEQSIRRDRIRRRARADAKLLGPLVADERETETKGVSLEVDDALVNVLLARFVDVQID